MAQDDLDALAAKHGGASGDDLEALAAKHGGKVVPFTPLPDPHNAHIGPIPDTAPVSLRDMEADPRGSMKRIGNILKQDLTDPKLWLAAAAAYFGPKVFEAIGPGVGELAAQAGKTAARVELHPLDALSELDVIHPARGVIRGLGKLVSVAPKAAGAEVPGFERFGGNSGGLPPARSPAPEAPSAPPQATSPSPATPEPPVTESAPSAKLQPGEGDTYIQLRKAGKSNTEALKQIIADRQAPPARISLTADETKAYLQLRNAGKSDAQAKDAIVAMRSLAKNLPSGSQVRAAVKERNASGRWETEQP